MSDDGRQGLTVIAFIGSVFSPYYAWARRGGQASAENHNAFNVVLHGEPGWNDQRWSMTERPRVSLARDADSLRIGPSSMNWDGTKLRLQIDEIGFPVPTKLRGEVVFHPEILGSQRFALDDAGQHVWTPIAPRGRIDVVMRNPHLNWSGEAYLDCNYGATPMERAFTGWTWSRAALHAGAAVLYDIAARDAAPRSLALRFDSSGQARTMEVATHTRLPASRWGIERHTRSDAGATTRVARTLVDAPFYARSLLHSRLFGESVTAVHESLSLDRFASGWVQALLPFRMPRARR